MTAARVSNPRWRMAGVGCTAGRARVRRRAEGAERARQAALRHGYYTAEARAERRIARAALVGLRAALADADLGMRWE